MTHTLENAPLLEFLSAETRALLNSIYDGVYIVDLDRRILFWNRGAELLTGYSADDVTGRRCRDNILNHLDENGTLQCVKDCPLGKAMQNMTHMEVKLFPLHRAGHRFPISTHIAPIKNREGEIIGAIEVFRDISAEEKLQALQKKFEKLIKQYVSKTTYDSVIEAAKTGAVSASAKELTVFFMDIVGFTTMSEIISPEQVVAILNQFFTLSSHVIERHLGDIDKYIGDCVMANFIEAQDAVAAAREILYNGLPSLNRVLAEKGMPAIQVRIGINSGRLVQGDIGSDSRKDLTVIGDVVNTASRVEHAAQPGNMLISESTWARLADPGRYEFDQEIRLKGKTVPIKLYRPKPENS